MNVVLRMAYRPLWQEKDASFELGKTVQPSQLLGLAQMNQPPIQLIQPCQSTQVAFYFKIAHFAVGLAAVSDRYCDCFGSIFETLFRVFARLQRMGSQSLLF